MCGLNSLVVYFNVQTRDVREGNVIAKSEIWTKNIHSLGFQDIGEGVTLMRLILQSLECICLLIWFNIKHSIFRTKMPRAIIAMVRTLHIEDPWKFMLKKIAS